MKLFSVSTIVFHQRMRHRKEMFLDHKSCPELPANVVEKNLVDVCRFDSVDRLCTFYSDLFDVDNFKKPTKHKTQHHIRTSGPPCVAKVRKLSPEKLETLRTELDKLLQLGIIYRSESEWASPEKRRRLENYWRLSSTKPPNHIRPLLHSPFI